MIYHLCRVKILKACLQALWRQNHELIRDTGLSLYNLLSYCMTSICKYGPGGCWRPTHRVLIPGSTVTWYMVAMVLHAGGGVGIEGGVW